MLQGVKAPYGKGEQRIRPGLESCTRNREVPLEAETELLVGRAGSEDLRGTEVTIPTDRSPSRSSVSSFGTVILFADFPFTNVALHPGRARPGLFFGLHPPAQNDHSCDLIDHILATPPVMSSLVEN